MSVLRVAVVDDARFIREALVRLLQRETRVQVVGTACTGEELLEHLDEWRPDVITLDLMMPGMGGMATLDRVMQTRPTPVIILSTSSGEGAPQTVEALHRGAVDFIDKEAYSLVDFEALRAVLVKKILGVAGAHLPEDPADLSDHEEPAPPSRPAPRADTTRYDLIVIGASTGGPKAVEQVLTDLGPSVPVPVVVVQHMPPGFTTAFAQRLHRALPLPVHETSDGDRLCAGHVYVAAAGRHIAIRKVDDQFAVGRPESPDHS
ncbi:MAG: chemotaxis protein CheB, partial [Planctomycetota bacterium]